MPISKEQVARVAGLARLRLTPDELDKFSRDLSRIVDYVACLDRVDTRGIDVGMQSDLPRRALRDDIARPSLAVDEALRNAPEIKDTYFIVPRVI
jgi:aspartyl-tRNA(Asn)/glutamyl-tRNA(Gln) amidotransferase subunit C